MRLLLQLIICLYLALPLTVWAEVATKDPFSYNLKTYGLMLAVSILGGLVSFSAKVRRGEVHELSLMHLVGEICTSAFAGLLTFWCCEWLGISQLITASLVGIAGHMGAKALAIAETAAKKKFAQQFGDAA